MSASRGSNSRPSSPSRSASSYCGRRATTGTAPPASARSTSCGAGAAPVGRGHDDLRAGQVLGLRAVAGPGELARGRAAAAAADRRARWPGRAARSSPASPGRSDRRRSARRNSRSAPRSSSAENTISGGPLAVVCGPVQEVGARADQAVVAGEVALHQLAGHGEARGAPVEAPEQQLHHPARDLGREQPLGGAVEAPDVQRARMAQRRRGRAGRERLVHVHEVELGVLEQVLQRARHVERQRHRAAAPEGQALAHGHERGAPGSANSASGSRCCASTRARPSRTSSRESDGATTTTLWPRAHSSSDSRSTKWLTSWCCSHGYGVTCAIA